MRKNKKNPDRIPAWMWSVICIILGIAVFIGIVAFVLQMGYFEEGFDLNAIPTNMEVAEETEQELEEEVEEDLSCTDLVLSQDEVVLEEEGARLFLTAMVIPEGCTDPIFYTSMDEEIATVSDSGMVTAVAMGETEILVTCGDMEQVCKVTCAFETPEEEIQEEEAQEETEQTEQEEQTQEEEQPQTAAKPELTPSDFTLFYPGEEAYLTVKNAPEGTAISYVSSNAAVVTVTENGKVTAVGNGQATITVTVGDTQLTAIARCNLESTTEGGTAAAPSQTYTGPFALNYTDVTFQFAGEKLNLALTDANGTKVSGLSWVTGNGSVCTVNNGVVTALGSGYTTVSTTYNGTTYSCIIRTSF